MTNPASTEKQSMLAGAYLGVGKIEAVERDIPTANAGEVIIKVARAGICGTDMHTYLHGGFMPEGMTIGHEFSGTICAVGDGVSDIDIGQRVTANPMHDHIGLFADGAFAEYIRPPNARLDHTVFALPELVNDEQAALVEPLAVALRGINHCQINEDSTVLIQGLGTIGLCALLIARQRGIKQIIAVDRAGCRLELAEKLGAITHELGSEGLESLLIAHFGSQQGLIPGPKLDLVIDATGNEAALAQGINLLAPQGQLLVLGTYAAPITVDMTFFVAKELKMFGSLAYQQEFPAALSLIATGEVDVLPLISHRFPLQAIDQAVAQQARAGESIKVMLTME